MYTCMCNWVTMLYSRKNNVLGKFLKKGICIHTHTHTHTYKSKKKKKKRKPTKKLKKKKGKHSPAYPKMLTSPVWIHGLSQEHL